MAKSKELPEANQGQVIRVKTRMSWKTSIKRYWQLYLLLLVPIIYFIIFRYGPMEYIITAFKKYKINAPVWEMEWAKNKKRETDVFFYFKQAFQDNQFLRALKNTVILNVLDLVVGFPAPIIFALILNELVFKRFKKVVQTVAYMPHFLSWVIIYGLS
ncbi:MAG: hypothetical protein IKH42_03420, partial [Lachnospiraceae bacterium]|nr:hypothetical protein [Lachnospiraceae bacterium]